MIYSYTDDEGKRRQKWETYKIKSEAQKRKKEIEYKESIGSFIIPQCKDLNDLLKEYVELYGKDKWSLSSYDRNLALINNYIGPSIGQTKLEDINTRFLEKFYQQLLKMPAVPRNFTDKKNNRTVGVSTIRDIHKLLRSCFAQAQKWELVEKNPAVMATVPKYKAKKREIWTAETLLHATEVCDDEELKLAMNLAFACSLRIGELVALTWDCVDISPEAIREGRAFIYIIKNISGLQRTPSQNLMERISC